MKKLFPVLVVAVLFSPKGESQEVWSMQRCVEYAKVNSLAIKQADLGVKDALLSQKQSSYSRLPSVNASVTGGVQFGRTIDPTTNSFDNQTIGFNSYQINAGATLFAGNRINNAVKQAKLSVDIAQLDAEAASDNLNLLIATTYLNILMGEEQLVNSQNRIKLSRQQLEQVDKLIGAGMRPEADRLNVVAQVALDEQSAITVQNLVEQGYLQLKNLLQLDPGRELRIEKPAISIPATTDAEAMNFQMVYTAALSSQPAIKAADLRKQNAGVGVDLAKAGYWPTLSVFGGLDTRWSSVAKSLDGFTTVLGDPVNVYIDNQPVKVQFESVVPQLSDTPFGDQVTENFGQSVGVSLQVPIYSQHRNSVSVQRADLGLLAADYSAEQTRQQLKNDVQSALANARASRLAFAAAQKAYDAAKAAYDNTDKRYKFGAVSTFEYTTSRTNLDTAETEMIRAKYDLVFRLKIVDFYLGRELRL
jgi:outer membrane protein